MWKSAGVLQFHVFCTWKRRTRHVPGRPGNAARRSTEKVQKAPSSPTRPGTRASPPGRPGPGATDLQDPDQMGRTGLPGNLQRTSRTRRGEREKNLQHLIQHPPGREGGVASKRAGGLGCGCETHQLSACGPSPPGHLEDTRARSEPPGPARAAPEVSPGARGPRRRRPSFDLFTEAEPAGRAGQAAILDQRRRRGDSLESSAGPVGAAESRRAD